MNKPKKQKNAKKTFTFNDYDADDNMYALALLFYPPELLSN